MSVNLGGMINCLLAFLPRLVEQEGDKHMVLTASIAGLAPFGMTIYSTTKYAIVGMGESLAQESETNGYGIGVSILCPGGVATNFGTSDRNRPDGLLGQQVSPVGTAAVARIPKAVSTRPWTRARWACPCATRSSTATCTSCRTRTRAHCVEARSARLGAAYDKAAAHEPGS